MSRNLHTGETDQVLAKMAALIGKPYQDPGLLSSPKREPLRQHAAVPRSASASPLVYRESSLHLHTIGTNRLDQEQNHSGLAAVCLITCRGQALAAAAILGYPEQPAKFFIIMASGETLRSKETLDESFLEVVAGFIRFRFTSVVDRVNR